jgi:predicted peptidase
LPVRLATAFLPLATAWTCFAAAPGATSRPALIPGRTFTLQFADMPPTFAELVEPNGVKAQMAVYLPKNYDPNRLHPLLVFLNGGDGGRGANLGVARGVTEGNDFICVSPPLFHKAAPGTPGYNYIIYQEDGNYMWPFFKRMMAELERAVPNIDPDHRIIGGFSNGAHATAALLDESGGEIARRFSAVLFVEGGGKLEKYELLKGKPFLMVSSNAKSRPRAQQICDAAKDAGAEASLIFEDVGKHDFPVAAYPAVRQWLRGPALGRPTPATASAPASEPAGAIRK